MSVPLSLPRRPLRYLAAALLVTVLFLYWHALSADAYPYSSSASGSASGYASGRLLQPGRKLQPANSTLGFGHVYVLSKEDSPRREGLVQAANVTDIEIEIPKQPRWSWKDEEGFRLEENSTIGRGSLLAWLGHLNTLKTFLDSGAETALILEDDVDWDIRLRSLQTPLAAHAIRSLFPPTKASAEKYPYGDPASWDLLYMGHCGDYFHGMDVGFERGHVVPANLTRTPHVAFSDPSLPAPEDLHPWTRSLMENLGVPPHVRLVHRSRFPLCTFAYAVTRASATRLVEELAPREQNREGDHAYDITILRACISDGLRCWSVNPELFHHVPGQSMIAGVDGEVNIPPVDESGWDQAVLRRETSNIDCGFWDGSFRFEEGDGERLEWLRREVGWGGNCRKSFREGRERERVAERVERVRWGEM